MNESFLARPDVRYKDSFINALREFHTVDNYTPPWNWDKLKNNFDEYVTLRCSYKTDPPQGRVPQTEYWLIDDDQFIGQIDIRHHLNDALKRFGGHIGYRIRPSARQQGYGTLQLKLALPKVWGLGIQRALVTCDDDNIGSQRIIEANGGILHDKIDNGRYSLTRRYWINAP